MEETDIPYALDSTCSIQYISVENTLSRIGQGKGTLPEVKTCY